MLGQALQLSQQMMAMIESGENLDQLEPLELKRQSILMRCADQATVNDELLQSDAALLMEIVELNRLIKKEVKQSRNLLRGDLASRRRNHKNIQAYH
ncbi:MAG: hypothetical protein HOD58_13115 [Gammaproteobacteria bacterium]|jgi:hypothetical protein|nr:hypothetical protein [Candidatus Neomarinimicrobiota bacterium]MBT4330853.1 hypothetical protein [Gammaproteobacteria bacterium]MBT4606389.1 hypothetical protein [Thiotrichales bacterium]MBT5269437.1 hypothetical protein [Candidatus Neomarinimicrobiota bacterium]MBT7081824.1 hypothetical protein [Chloroflexota bacterium]